MCAGGLLRSRIRPAELADSRGSRRRVRGRGRGRSREFTGPTPVDALRGAGLDHPDAPVFVQSFDPASLRMLRMELRVPLVQLVDDDSPHLVVPENLLSIAEYADVVGAHKSLVIPRTETGSLGAPGPLVDDAHALGLAVHAFTFRDENAFLPLGCDGGAECVAFLEAGVDALFADHPDTAVAVRDRLADRGMTPGESGADAQSRREVPVSSPAHTRRLSS